MLCTACCLPPRPVAQGPPLPHVFFLHRQVGALTVSNIAAAESCRGGGGARIIGPWRFGPRRQGGGVNLGKRQLAARGAVATIAARVESYSCHDRTTDRLNQPDRAVPERATCRTRPTRTRSDSPRRRGSPPSSSRPT